MNEELKVIISAELAKFKKELDNGKKELKDLDKQGKASGEKLGKAMSAAGKAVSGAMKLIGGAIAGGLAAIVGLSEGTKEYATAQAKLKSAFESAGLSATEAKETYNDLYRVLGDTDQATEAANHLAKLTQNQEDLAEWTKVCQGVYATFGDSLPIESLTEAANETAKTGMLTGALADAINWAGINEDDFAASLMMCNDEAEREALIRETLTGLYSDAAAAYEKNAADLLAANEAQALLTDTMAELGAVARPIVTIFKTELAGALQEILPHIQLVGEGLQDIMNGVDGGAEKMSTGIADMLNALITKIVELLPTLLTVGIQVVTALLEGIVQALPAILDAVISIIPQILDAIFSLLPQVTGAILGALPAIIKAIVQVVVGILDGLSVVLPQILDQIVAILPDIIQEVIDAIPLLLDAAINFLMAIVEAIPEIIPPLIDALPDLIDSLIETLLENYPAVMDGALAIFMGIVDAIPQIIPSIVNALPKIISSLVSGIIQATPQILNAGLKMFAAIPEALVKIIPSLLNGASQLVSNLQTNLVNKLKSLFKFEWNLPKLKVPKFSITPSGWSIGDLLKGQIPKLGITWNAKGGVFEKPTLFGYGNSLQGLGENGAEAVVPLENNLEWLNKLADMLSDKLQPAPVVLEVDGTVFAKTSVKAINQLTRQTGKLALNLT